MIDVLTGLTNSSVPHFILFVFVLQQANAKALEFDTHWSSTFEQVKTILSKAVDTHHSLSTAGKWYVNSKSTGNSNVVCWNCEREGCSVKKCLQPKDQKKIATNNKKLLEQKQNVGGNKSSVSDEPSSYNPNKLGHPGRECIKAFGKKLMSWCEKKDCG